MLQIKILVLILVKQRQNFRWTCIIMVNIAISWLTGKKILKLKQKKVNNWNFQINFVYEAYLINMTIPIQKTHF